MMPMESASLKMIKSLIDAVVNGAIGKQTGKTALAGVSKAWSPRIFNRFPVGRQTGGGKSSAVAELLTATLKSGPYSCFQLANACRI